MMRITKLDSFSSELSLRYTKSHPLSVDTLSIQDVQGNEQTTLTLFKYENGVGRFRITNDVHALPFGRYQAVLMSGNCCCGCLPIEIPKCSLKDADLKDRVNELHCKDEDIPIRDCVEKECKDCCDDDCCCDPCTGCENCNPCDPCHPCFKENEVKIETVEEPVVVYDKEAEEVLFQ